jgi:hypothetical protein
MFDPIEFDPTPFNEIWKKMSSDVALILVGIFVILLIAYIVDFTCRWYEIGRKYRT